MCVWGGEIEGRYHRLTPTQQGDHYEVLFGHFILECEGHVKQERAFSNGPAEVAQHEILQDSREQGTD